MCGLWEHTLPPHRTRQLLPVCKQSHEEHRLNEFLILCSSECKIPLIIPAMMIIASNIDYFYVPGTKSFHVLIHLILTTALWGRYL